MMPTLHIFIKPNPFSVSMLWQQNSENIQIIKALQSCTRYICLVSCRVFAEIMLGTVFLDVLLPRGTQPTRMGMMLD